MIHEAIYALNPSVITIRGDVAYDKNGNEVDYDKETVSVKAAELEAAEQAKLQAQADAKVSAFAKLKKLGLTEDEVKSLLG